MDRFEENAPEPHEILGSAEVEHIREYSRILDGAGDLIEILKNIEDSANRPGTTSFHYEFDVDPSDSYAIPEKVVQSIGPVEQIQISLQSSDDLILPGDVLDEGHDHETLEDHLLCLSFPEPVAKEAQIVKNIVTSIYFRGRQSIYAVSRSEYTEPPTDSVASANGEIQHITPGLSRGEIGRLLVSIVSPSSVTTDSDTRDYDKFDFLNYSTYPDLIALFESAALNDGHFIEHRFRSNGDIYFRYSTQADDLSGKSATVFSFEYPSNEFSHTLLFESSFTDSLQLSFSVVDHTKNIKNESSEPLKHPYTATLSEFQYLTLILSEEIALLQSQQQNGWRSSSLSGADLPELTDSMGGSIEKISDEYEFHQAITEMIKDSFGRIVKANYPDGEPTGPEDEAPGKNLS